MATNAQKAFQKKMLNYHMEQLKTDPQYGTNYDQGRWASCLVGLFIRSLTESDLPNTVTGVLNHGGTHLDGTLRDVQSGREGKRAVDTLFGEDFTTKYLASECTIIQPYGKGRDALALAVYAVASDGGITKGPWTPIVIGALEDVVTATQGLVSKYVINDLRVDLNELGEEIAKLTQRQEEIATRLRTDEENNAIINAHVASMRSRLSEFVA